MKKVIKDLTSVSILRDANIEKVYVFKGSEGYFKLCRFGGDTRNEFRWLPMGKSGYRFKPEISEASLLLAIAAVLDLGLAIYEFEDLLDFARWIIDIDSPAMGVEGDYLTGTDIKKNVDKHQSAQIDSTVFTPGPCEAGKQCDAIISKAPPGTTITADNDEDVGFSYCPYCGKPVAILTLEPEAS